VGYARVPEYAGRLKPMHARAGAQRALATAAAGLLIFLAAAAFGAVRASADGLWVEPSSAREEGGFWTPARMRAAEPIELYRHPGPFLPTRRSKHERRGGPPGASAYGANFEQVPDPTAPEFRVHGALFLSFGIFGYGRCSATSVDSGNRSVVITAAHCLNSGGRRGRWFSGRLAFVPAYRFGQRPFGVFPARWIDTTRQWRADDSENFDVGAVVVGRNQRGQRLGEAVGGTGIAFNLKPNQVFDVHGYPAEEPFDGETQRVCKQTPFLGHDPSSFVSPGPLNLAVACDATGGASGGGWTIEGNILNGVTSYGYFDEGSPDYGPYFGREVALLYERAARVR
jgi:V8-like Glu-specific endopeptidase